MDAPTPTPVTPRAALEWGPGRARRGGAPRRAMAFVRCLRSERRVNARGLETGVYGSSSALRTVASTV
jgi:hypothetical protein